MRNTTIYEDSFIAKTLNLDSVLFKLCHERGDQKWPLAKARAVEQDYRKWLFLHQQFPGTKLVPTADIDEMWHTHILDTMAYANDCQAMFGHFLHHYPYAGMVGSDDMNSHMANAAATADLFFRTFGEQLVGHPAECTNCCDTDVVLGANLYRPTVKDLARTPLN
jgi:hypothetical protein